MTGQRVPQKGERWVPSSQLVLPWAIRSRVWVDEVDIDVDKVEFSYRTGGKGKLSLTYFMRHYVLDDEPAGQPEANQVETVGA